MKQNENKPFKLTITKLTLTVKIGMVVKTEIKVGSGLMNYIISTSTGPNEFYTKDGSQVVDETVYLACNSCWESGGMNPI